MLKIYNTLSRQKEAFTPIAAPQVNMYVCGITVYDYCHIGHARVVVVFDMIVRWLIKLGYQVKYVRNITDIDDKIIKQAAHLSTSIQTVTDYFTKAMHEDFAALGVAPPTLEPRATQCIDVMQQMIKKLIEKNYAYVAENQCVYYEVNRFKAYGKLSGKSLQHLSPGERVELDNYKRNPLDFVLWKAAKPDEPYWDSPWGPGRPGWHIECSAMSKAYLGAYFDIHGGGQDLQFPHHENEIAQSEGLHDHTFVKYWIHNGFVRVDNEKMSKSTGNFFTIRDVLKNYLPEVVRFFILRAHYRSPLNYSQANLEDAKNSLTKLYLSLNNKVDNQPATAIANINNTALNYDDIYSKRFKVAMDDDFNTVEAISVLFDIAHEINKTQSIHLTSLLIKLGAVLGILQADPEDFLRSTVDSVAEDSYTITQIEALIKERHQARLAGDFIQADALRSELLNAGIILEDNGHETLWRRR